MKILIVNKFLFQHGGSETYLFAVGQELQRQGHDVEYFGMEHPERLVGNRAESYTPNMDFHTGKLRRLLYPFQIIYSRTARKRLRPVLEDFNPDVVHLNNFNYQLTPSIIYEIIRYGKKEGKKIKILYTAHDVQLVCPNHLMRIPGNGKLCQRCLAHGYFECVKNSCIHGSKIKSVLACMEAVLYKRLKTYKYIDCVICPSQFMEEQLNHREELRGKTRVLHNFSSFDGREMKKISGVRDYVIYFGRFSEEKGIRTLLKVCRSLPDIPFVMVGSGPMEKEVNEIVNVKNMGFQKGQDLIELIQRARFSIIPSEWYENCPFSVIESLSCGTPVIGSRIGGIPELIQEGKTGELFRTGDADELKDKVERLWNDEARVSSYSKACSQQKFDTIESYCRKLIGIMEKV